MKKLYVILTVDIHPIGGNQLYTAGQAKYMESIGWDVIILFPGKPFGKCKIKYLEKYLSGGFQLLWDVCPDQLDKDEIYNVYERIINKMYINTDIYNEILIASQNQKLALWGESFANIIKAKHFCFITTEIYRGKDTCFEEYMDFYVFKYLRKELLALDVKKLFDGYLEIDEKEIVIPDYCEGEVVQDVFDETIRDIRKEDWNIAYIGRSEKKYVLSVIREVSLFAKKHKEQKIQFIMVGDANCRLESLNKYLFCVPNVHVLLLGDLIPIPRELFSITDVIIAGSGSAIYSAIEGVPTIVVDADNCLSNGILGYTCLMDEVVYHNHNGTQYTISDSLEDVLVSKQYLQYKYNRIVLEDSNKYYKWNLERFYVSEKDNVYYAIGKDRKEHSYFDNVEKLMKKNCENKDKIIIFGAGKYGRECYDMLNSVNEKVEFFVDNDSAKWYEELCGCIIFPAEKLYSEKNSHIIIACEKGKDDICEQLMQMDVLKSNNIVDYKQIYSYILDRIRY